MPSAAPVQTSQPAPVAEFCRAVSESSPGAAFAFEGPSEGGFWWVQVQASGNLLEVEWRPGRGFGLAVPGRDAVFGEGVDEVYRDAALAARRAAQLLSRPASQTTTWLRQLREVRGISQVELAARLKVNQAAVSRLENRDDLKLTTLLAAVEALGGHVEVVAHFKECDIPLRLPEPAAPVKA